MPMLSPSQRQPRRRLSDTLRAAAAPLPTPDLAAAPARARMSGGATGESSSPTALDRLNEAMAALKAQAVLPFVHQSLALMRADRHREGAEMALKALQIDEKCGVAWHLVAICREKAGDFTSALKCYESALELCPDEPEIANDLGRLAYAMGMKDTAEQLFAHYLGEEARPGGRRQQPRLHSARPTALRAGHRHPAPGH